VGPGWADNDLAVCNACGEIVRPSTVSRHFGALMSPPALKATKRNPEPEPRKGPLATPCRFHDLRDTYATNAIAAGIPIKDVSVALGHANASFTMDVYVGRTKDQDRAIADHADERLYGRVQTL
jgi:integrase